MVPLMGQYCTMWLLWDHIVIYEVTIAVSDYVALRDHIVQFGPYRGPHRYKKSLYYKVVPVLRQHCSKIAGILHGEVVKT